MIEITSGVKSLCETKVNLVRMSIFKELLDRSCDMPTCHDCGYARHRLGIDSAFTGNHLRNFATLIGFHEPDNCILVPDYMERILYCYVPDTEQLLYIKGGVEHRADGGQIDEFKKKYPRVAEKSE